MDWQDNMSKYGNIFGIDVQSNMSKYGNIFGIDTSGWGSSSSSSSSGSSSSSTPSTTYGMDSTSQGYFDKAWSTIDEAKGYVSGLIGVANQTLDAWNQYKSEYDPVRKQALSLAGQEYGAKSGYLSKLENVDNQTYDYAAGKAGADIAQQAEIARQEQARALARQGVNAASGKSQALTQQGFLQEALAKAGAMTNARNTARDKNFSESLSAYSAIDPSKSVGTALSISSGANQLLGMYNDTMTKQAGYANDNANTASGLAHSYGNTQLGYSKLNQQAASDAASIGLGYYQADKNYDIANRSTTLKEKEYQDSRNDYYRSLGSSTASRASSGGGGGSSKGTWKQAGAASYNTATGEYKYPSGTSKGNLTWNQGFVG